MEIFFDPTFFFISGLIIAGIASIVRHRPGSSIVASATAASGFTNNRLMRISSSQFVNSLLSDDGTNVTLTSGDLTLSTGNITVTGNVGLDSATGKLFGGGGVGSQITLESSSNGSGTSPITFRTAGSTKAVLTAAGNFGIGTAAPGGSSTVGTAVLSLANGTPPVGGVANQVSLYSNDVAASAELFALDEAGNIPQLSPHPSDFLNTRPVKIAGPYAYPWVYRSSNHYLGKRITVDMAGLVEWALASGAPAGILSIEDLPPEEKADWDIDQETQRARRQAEINTATTQIADLDAKIATETDSAKKDGLIKQRGEVKVPAPYIKKRPPKWIVDRGVISAIQ